MVANLTTKLGQLVDVLTPDTTNTRIGVANASPTRTLDVTGTFGASGASTLGSALTYGGVTLSNSVTGTGSMVLSNAPSFVNTVVFSGAPQAWTASGATTGSLFGNLINTSGNTILGVAPSTGGGTISGAAAYASYVGSYASQPFHLVSGATVRVTVSASGAVQMNAYGAGTATFDASGNITSVSDPSQKIITGTYTDGLAAIVAVSSDEFMGWHKWRPESGMETEGTYASFFARDNFPVSGAVTKNGDRPNSFNDRPVVMALVNAVAELKAEIEALKGTH